MTAGAGVVRTAARSTRRPTARSRAAWRRGAATPPTGGGELRNLVTVAAALLRAADAARERRGRPRPGRLPGHRRAVAVPASCTSRCPAGRS